MLKYLDTIYVSFFALILFFAGASIGSFIYCYLFRQSRGLSALSGRSECTECHHVLGPLDLVPVLSWLWLRGRCHYCGAKISVRYWLCEVSLAVTYVLIFLDGRVSLETAGNIIIFTALFYGSVSDLLTRDIPPLIAPICLAVSAVLRVVYGLSGGFTGVLKDVGISLLCGVVVFLLFYLPAEVLSRIRHCDSIGGGDLKLLFVCGFYLGPTKSYVCIFAAAVLGLLTKVFVKSRDGSLPFYPALSIAALMAALWGDKIVNWYLSICGIRF